MDKDLLIAEIRNKLQAPRTALELLSEDKDVPKRFIKTALEGIDRIVELLEELS